MRGTDGLEERLDGVIEFVPQTDSQVVGMLSRMPKAADAYAREAFERAYRGHFDILASTPVAGTDRLLYEMRRLEGKES